MQFCLIETWADENILPNDCQALAISPLACYELEKAGIEYHIFEDYCPQSQTQNFDKPDYTESQMKWFKEFDEEIKNIYPEAKQLNLNLASLYYYNIKFLTDHLISNIYLLGKFLDKTNPTKIWYVQQKQSTDNFDMWTWFNNGKNSYFRIIKPVCESRLIDCEELSNNLTRGNISKRKKYTQKINLIFKKIISESKILIKTIIPLINNIRYGGLKCPIFIRRSKDSKNSKKPKILIIKVFKQFKDFIQDCKNNGYTITFFEHKNLQNVQPIKSNYSVSLDCNNGLKTIKNITSEKATAHLLQHTVFKWINMKCGVDLSTILYSRFKYIIEDVFPTTIELVTSFIKYYKVNQIDFVFTNSLATYYDFAAVAAARISKNTKSIGFLHGIDGMKDEDRYFKENCHFDLYFATTSMEVAHIHYLKQKIGNDYPIVNTNSYYQKYIMKFRPCYINKYTNKNAKQVVLFLPIIRKNRNSAPIHNHLQTMQSIRWHNMLIDYFITKNRFEFIWKAPGNYNDNFDDTVGHKIKNLDASNLKYSRKPLTKYLNKVDKVICDIASTGYFECLIAGLPALTFDKMEYGTTNKEIFPILGKSLQQFTTLEDKMKIVDNFIESRCDEYVVNLKSDNNKVIDIINKNMSIETIE